MKIGSGAVEHPMAPDLGLSGFGIWISIRCEQA